MIVKDCNRRAQRHAWKAILVSNERESRMTSRRFRFLHLHLLFVVVAGGAHLAAAPAAAKYAQGGDTPNLTGEWSLNKDLSDDARKAAASGDGGRARPGGGGRMPGGGGGRGGGRGGGMGGGRGAGMDPERMQQTRASMSEAMRPPARITITQTVGAVTMTDGEGRSQTFSTDGKKEKHQIGGRTVETKTRWSGARLSKEISFGDGLTVTETYALAPENNQLHVIAKVEHSKMGRPVTLKRIYDRTPPR